MADVADTPEVSGNPKTVELSNGPEYRVLANFFGVMLASAGLLAGTMFKERSLDYWQDDAVSILLFLITGRGLLKNSMQLARESMIYTEKKKMMDAFLAKQHEVLDGEDNNDAIADIQRITEKSHYTEEEVLEAVSKRIQEQRDKGMKNNKLVNS